LAGEKAFAFSMAYRRSQSRFLHFLIFYIIGSIVAIEKVEQTITLPQDRGCRPVECESAPSVSQISSVRIVGTCLDT
jgi:hypothetical protein